MISARRGAWRQDWGPLCGRCLWPCFAQLHWQAHFTLKHGRVLRASLMVTLWRFTGCGCVLRVSMLLNPASFVMMSAIRRGGVGRRLRAHLMSLSLARRCSAKHTVRIATDAISQLVILGARISMRRWSHQVWPSLTVSIPSAISLRKRVPARPK